MQAPPARRDSKPQATRQSHDLTEGGDESESFGAELRKAAQSAYASVSSPPAKRKAEVRLFRAACLSPCLQKSLLIGRAVPELRRAAQSAYAAMSSLPAKRKAEVHSPFSGRL